MVRELTVFTDGDSGELSTWSNVPYFFTETLIAKGVKVNRINISPNQYLKGMYKFSAGLLIKKLLRNSSHDYFRSWIHFRDVRRRIKKAGGVHAGSDAFIFLTFSFSSAGLLEKPTVLFGDWTYDHYFKKRLKRAPRFFEKRSIRRENEQIENADLVFPLFPRAAGYMKNKYDNANIHYLGNVINSVYPFAEEEILEQKKRSNKILFIGGPKYLAGAKKLIKAFARLKKKHPALSLHFIGFKTSDFCSLPKDVHCHGYLDKGKQADRDLYYSLLKEAKVFVNTTPLWAAFSASIESMYFFNPVVVTPSDEFIETFGERIESGVYCEENTESLIAEKIEHILTHPDYEQLCRKAHQSVKHFTWDSYIDRILEEIAKKLQAARGEKHSAAA